MKRRYAVWHSSSKITGELEAYFVTDISADELERHKKFIDNLDRISRIDYLAQEKFRPRVATFPISELYDESTQCRRAEMMADYLNKLCAAQEQAESQAIFVDLLKAQHPSSQP